MRRIAAVASVVLAMTAAPGLPGTAVAQEDLGSISPAHPELEQEFPPIPAVYPLQANVAHPFAAFRPALCEEAPYCDALEIGVEVPEGYREFYAVDITLDWTPGPAGNQLTFHVWPDDDPLEGAPIGPCSSPKDEACLGRRPISLTLIEPAPAEPILITVVNAEGVNLGYTIQATFYELDLDLGDFPDPELEFAAPPEQARSDAGRPRLQDLFANPEAVEDPDRPRILVPGADGEMTELEVPALAAGQLEPDTGRSVNPFITAGILIPLLGSLAFFLVLRRRSRGVS